MKALVCQGRGKQGYQDTPQPVIKEQTDAIVRVTNPTICGRDVNTMLGMSGSATRGRILGQEGTGIVDQVGERVRNFRSGDCVLISCLTSCGACEYCTSGLAMLCTHGGLLLGNSLDGTCAEYVRVPFADHSLFAFPSASDEKTDGGGWIEKFHEGFNRGTVDVVPNAGHTGSVVVGSSVGLGAPLAIAQYCRSVIGPILCGQVYQSAALRPDRG
jgi:alcohol dehydrogenase